MGIYVVPSNGNICSSKLWEYMQFQTMGIYGVPNYGNICSSKQWEYMEFQT